MDDAEVVLTPREAARRLGVSPSGLRRLAGVYGDVFGELQKDASGTSRVWPAEAVARLEAARALMASGRARSVKDGLRAVERGAGDASEAALVLGEDGRIVEALGVVAARLEALQYTNRRLEVEIAALHREVAELRALPNAEVGVSSSAQVVEPQRAEQQEWVEEVSRRGMGLGVRRPTDGGDEDGVLVQMARRLERLLGRR